MKLAIFDIDGTLTETNEVDDKCFVEAFAASHGLIEIETDWTKYKHVTDSGIVSEVIETKLNRTANKNDFIAFKKKFIEKLTNAAEKDKSAFAEIRNTAQMLKKLQGEKRWAIALATGSFYDSAILKLKTAKIDFIEFPIATADDAVSREEILQIAIKKSLAHYGQKNFEKIISVGDGVWDLRTAKNLNLDFIGIAKGEKAEHLQNEGAAFIIENFEDYEGFWNYIIETT